MLDENDASDKTEDPTQTATMTRLNAVAKSQEINTWLVIVGRRRP